MHVIKSEELPVALQDGPFELRMQELGDMIVNFVKIPGGADFAPAFAGLPDDRCQVPHYGVVLKGRVYTDSAEGRQEYGANDVFYWAPGHVPGALEDSEYVDFAPRDGFLHLVDHVKKNMEGA